MDNQFLHEVEALASQGFRVLAIASGIDQTDKVAGLVALQDPPRPDAASLISRLKELGIRIVMITGDGLLTAKAIAAKIGIGDRACPGETLNDVH